MTLHQLASFRDFIRNQFRVNEAVTKITELSNNLTTFDKDLESQYSDFLKRNITAFGHTINSLHQQQNNSEKLLIDLNNHISNLCQEFLTDEYNERLDRAMTNVEVRMDREFTMQSEVRELAVSRIRNYSDWHYPGLELGCRKGSWTSHLIASDPLYLFELDQSFLDITIRQFPELYQRRVRGYTNIELLPTNQFSFVFSWDFFNYLGLNTTKRYLEKTFNLLRPGGTMMFSYNDGDTSTGIAYTEKGAQSYLPKHLLLDACKAIGFEIIATESFDNGVVNWIEIRRPGTLKTVKTAQALGEITIIQT
jgi:hypothetical protein